MGTSPGGDPWAGHWLGGNRPGKAFEFTAQDGTSHKAWRLVTKRSPSSTASLYSQQIIHMRDEQKTSPNQPPRTEADSSQVASLALGHIDDIPHELEEVVHLMPGVANRCAPPAVEPNIDGPPEGPQEVFSTLLHRTCNQMVSRHVG